MNIDFLEGTDYCGKSTAREIIMTLHPYTHHTLPITKEERLKIHALGPHERFQAFMQLNRELFKKVRGEYSPVDALIERSWPSTISYHNVNASERIETTLESDILGMEPNRIILVTADEAAIRRRMKARPPSHRNETDPLNLLRVQDEFLRLLAYTRSAYGIPYIVINNSTDDRADLEKELSKVM